MKTFRELQEGVYDPNIFKAFFLAGGPGSGKSYVARRTTGGMGLRVVNSDDAFESLLKKAGLSLKMPPEQEVPREVVRGRAKELTAKRKGNYLEGRLGLIIDGTGREFDKIQSQARQLQELGYDTYMIFVNTSLDVALQRNAERPRSVPESIVIKSWKAVQANLGKFNNFFGSGMIIVDNNDAGEDIFTQVFKRVQKLVKRKVQNTRAKDWIAMELAKKRR
jgi:dephospho-CoA kinase